MDHDDINAYLMRKYMSPVIVFVVVNLVVGIVGNSLVLVVYGKDYYKSVAWIFVYFLAVLDMCACLISLPTELTYFVNPAFYPSSEWCRIGHYLGLIFYESSSVVLMVTAFSRYDMICRQPKQWFNCSRAKKCCVAVVIFSSIIHIPALVIYGELNAPLGVANGTVQVLSINETIQYTTYWKEVRSGGANWTLDNPPVPEVVWSSMCTLNTQYYDHILTTSFFIFQIAVFLVLIVLVVFFYTKVISKLLRHQRKARQQFNTPSGSKASSSNLSDSGTVICNLQMPTTNVEPIKALRMSVILLSISAAFVIGFLPSKIILVWRMLTGPDTVASMTTTELSIFLLSLRSSSISNAINPILYGVLSREFRKRCMQLWKS